KVKLMKYLFFASFSLTVALSSLSAEPVPASTQNEAAEILADLRGINDPGERAIKISEKFFGRPFAWGPWGEGDAGSYEPSPLTRFDKFDCTTYVEAVLGLAFTKQAGGYEDFMATFIGIKYCDEKNICYPNR